jgi:hypothetical protein
VYVWRGVEGDGMETTGQKFNIIYNYRTVLKILIKEFYLLQADSGESLPYFKQKMVALL